VFFKPSLKGTGKSSYFSLQLFDKSLPRCLVKSCFIQHLRICLSAHTAGVTLPMQSFLATCVPWGWMLSPRETQC